MSTVTPLPPCQSLLALVKTPLDDFYHVLNEDSENRPIQVSLTLSEQELALFAATYKPGTRKIILLSPSYKLHVFLDLVKAWNSILGLPSTWHSIAHELSDQERSGLIMTPLSRTISAFLGTNPNDHFIIPSLKNDLVIPDPVAYSNLAIDVTVGEHFDSMRHVVERLVTLGYIRQTASLEPGTFRIQGEQLYISIPYSIGYYGITFLRSHIESITYYNDKRTFVRSSVRILPVLFSNDSMKLHEHIKDAVVIRPISVGHAQGSQIITYDALHTQHKFPFRSYETLPKDKSNNYYVLGKNEDHIRHFFTDQNLPLTSLCTTDAADVSIALAQDTNIIVSERFLFPAAAHDNSIGYRKGLELLGNLTIGKPAVHADHGIGLFEGLQKRTFGTYTRDYLILRYGEGDVLSVPVEFAHKVTAYIGEASPQLHRLGGVGTWLKTRKKAQEDAAALAKEMLRLAQERAKQTRDPYYIDPAIDDKLSATFPYTLTPDQLTTWQEIRHDLESNVPMDRLVVGDVGFGKTEIALRAAVHAMANGKQVAVIAPTTLLVQQHADTFTARLQSFHNTLGILSRFVPPKVQKAVKAGIEDGRIQIAIGTHALLSKHLHWKNLGLVIIDEEQRFGVKQKDHFKALRAHIDMVSLSATPIPRTLSMALSGLRNLSVITTAPQGRQEIKTFVRKDTDSMLRQAIAFELGRKGQVYVVSPRVQRLGFLQHRIKKLFPKTRMAIIHGQMEDSALAKVMHAFDEGSVDILIASTIIENGLDLPNANTLVVTSAPSFGLSDLYQLRGRVGRRDRQGQAYFLYEQQTFTPVQRERLAAITEASRLGSGWSLAQRDLEIRGAGNLLGAEQSGAVYAIGLQLYLDLVHDAIGNIQEVSEPSIHLPVSAYISPNYIHDVVQRTTWYQRLSRSHTPAKLTNHRKALEEQFGPLPPEVHTLYLLLQLKLYARALGIHRIETQTITPPTGEPFVRLRIDASSIPTLMHALASLGSVTVHQASLRFDMPDFTVETLESLITALKTLHR